MTKPSEPLKARVWFERPEAHLVEVEIEAAIDGPEATFSLPVWTPGSYKVRDFAKHVQNISARGPSGEPLPLEKLRKNAWRVSAGEARQVALRYQVYGFEFSVRTNHIDDGHAFLNNPNVFFYLEGEKDRPYEVSITPPEGWDLDGALPSEPQGARGRRYFAEDYHALADAPFFLGKFERQRFEARGIPHETIVYGQGNRPAELWQEDFQKIVEAEMELFGSSPLERYLFIVYLRPSGSGGLEHADSSVMQFPAHMLREKKDYQRFLSLIAHEYFHLWNGKRIRPAVFDDFDYDREIYTRSLWVVEGVTSYYDELILCRAGLITDDEYLAMILDHIQRLRRNPGRLHDSLEDASFDAWIKLYQRDEQTINASTSYYEKGQQVALLLDLRMRQLSEGKASLDDVVRRLWQENRESGGAGYPERRIEAIAAELVGPEIAAFFDENVRAAKSLDWDALLPTVGLKLEEKISEREPDLGVFLKTSGTRVVFDSVLEGGPAARAGFSARDEVVALDGEKVTRENFEERIKDRGPGTSVELHFFRAGQLRQGRLVLGGKAKLSLIKDPEATEAQKAAYQAWLGAPWESA